MEETDEVNNLIVTMKVGTAGDLYDLVATHAGRRGGRAMK